ncbi:MAG: bifunctional pyr operon transcriptional regulator/uracil phosphoribosyltransferase PyrR [Candidatus Saganbacteria bacterium]|nr:bifunctional pyr operon transcriptional regulator/uracil phosphoribosyltransferase PyrR [Candidatus Saganbacteria bacterium]
MAKKKKKTEKSPNLKIVMDKIEMGRALKRMARQIVESNKGVDNLAIVGIIQRGVPLAKRLAEIIAQEEEVNIPVGELDVSLYRDDLTKKGQYIEVRKSDIPFSLNNMTVVLVDDVIFAGRTARAALDGLKDYGRAAKVQLAALVDRGHRELPIHPDFVGKVTPTAKGEDVKVDVYEVDGVDRVVIK